MSSRVSTDDDTLQFNGNSANENMDLSANGSRLKLFRTQGNVTMDVAGVERVNVVPLGGADTITVNDLTHTDDTDVNLVLAATPGSGVGDSQVLTNCRHTSTVHRAGRDRIVVTGDAGSARRPAVWLPKRLHHHRAADRHSRPRLIVNAGDGAFDVQ